MSGPAAAGERANLGNAQTEQVVQAGLRVFHELKERTRMKDEEVRLYRDAIVKLAQREGVEVPSFTGEDGGFDAAKMREWLGRPLAAEEKSRTGGSKGRSGGGGRALGTRGKKTRGGEEEQKKRKWQDIIDEPDEEKAWTKRAKPLSAERERPVGKF